MTRDPGDKARPQGAIQYREIKLCSNKGAYEAIPSSRLDLDLEAIRGTLEAEDREIIDARVMLVILGHPEVTIARDGRLLFKTRDENEAKRSMEWLTPIVLRSRGPPK